MGGSGTSANAARSIASGHALAPWLDALLEPAAVYDRTGAVVATNAAWRRRFESRPVVLIDLAAWLDADGEPTRLDATVGEETLALLVTRAPTLGDASLLVRELAESPHEGIVSGVHRKPPTTSEPFLLRVAASLGRIGGWRYIPGAPAIEWTEQTRALHAVGDDFVPTFEGWLACYVEPSREVVAAAVARCLADGTPFDLEAEIRNARGRRLPVRAIGEAIRALDGRVVGVQGGMQDVSERRAAQRSLERSEQRFLDLLGALPVVVWTAEADGSVDHVNAAFLEYTGAPASQPAHDAWLACIHPEDFASLVAAWDAAQRREEPLKADVRLRQNGGRWRWHALRGTPVRTAAGHIGRWYGTAIDIDRARTSQDEARRLADRLRDTLEGIADAFFTLDGSLRFTFVNPEASRVLGREWSELLNTHAGVALDGELGRGLLDRLREVQVSGQPAALDDLRDDAGRRFSGRVSTSRQGLSVYLRDDTDARRAREELASNEERFRLLSRATNDAIWDWNVATDAMWWSDGFEALFGQVPAAARPSLVAWLAHVHPSDRDAYAEGVMRAVKDGASEWAIEYRWRRADGSYAYVRDRGHVVRDAAGQAVRLVGGMTDVTERMRDQERLAERAAIVESAHEGVTLLDLEGRVTYVNERARQIFGLGPDEAVGQLATDLHFAADAHAFVTAREGTLRDGDFRGDVKVRRRDGRPATVETRWTLLRDARNAPRALLVLDTDVTERRLLEQRVGRAQRLESIGTLAGGIAHDLNNLLAPILVCAELLGYGTQDPDRREDLATIETCARRAADMVTQLLSFARGVEVQHEIVRVEDVLAEVVRALRDATPPTVHLRAEPPRGRVSTVLASPTQIHQVLSNLCLNARDAMPNGGTLTIRVEDVHIDETYAGMHPEAKVGDYVRVTVNDTGTGMTADVLEHAFEPFFTTKDVGKGTGLGLSTTYAIVKSHGGFIHLSSDLGLGTTFEIHLPVAQAESRSRDDQLEHPQGRQELVLVVDDEAPIRQIVRRILERFGYRVVAASNGREGLEALARHGADIDLVLTDLAMPDMDGPTFVRALRLEWPDLPVVASSGVITAEGAKIDVQRFVAKPYTSKDLLLAIGSELERKRAARA